MKTTICDGTLTAITFNIEDRGAGGEVMYIVQLRAMVVFYEEPGERLWSFLMKTPGEVFQNSRNYSRAPH